MEYRPVRIVDVIDDINRIYFLPDIQREFVWEPEKVEKLFDSIMSDYPIGSFLFWKLSSENKNKWNTYEFIKNFDKEAPHNEPVEITGDRDIYLILDGQQRMTSLYVGLLGTYRYFYYKWRKTRLYLNILKPPIPNEDDPEELTFQFEFLEDEDISSNNGESEFWYRVRRILDYKDSEDAKSDIEKEISHLSEKQKDNAKKLVGKLHSRIHTVTVINYYEEKTPDPERVLTIFVRANSEGKPLEYSDLLLSTATAKWDKLNARDEVSNFTDNINNIGPGYSFGKDFVLKGSLYLTEDLPIQYKVKNFTKHNLLKIENNWDNIKSFIEASIKLVSRFGFNSKNIIAPIALLPIAFFMMKKGNTNLDKSSQKNDVSIQQEIQRWLIFALLKNAFGSSTDTKLKNVQDVLLGLPNYNVFPIKETNEKLGIEDKFTEADIEWIISLKYQGRYTYLVLSLLYPDRDWKGIVFHEDHIFPKSEFQLRKLKKRGYDEDKINRYLSYYDTILNLQLLTDSENLSKNSMPFDSWIKTREKDFKKRHLIPELGNYDLDRFEEFITERKSQIVNVLKNL